MKMNVVRASRLILLALVFIISANFCLASSNNATVSISVISRPLIQIPDQYIEMNDPGSLIYVDLWNYTIDQDDNVSNLTYTLLSESNTTLIDCYISLNRYFTCFNPLTDAYGFSNIIVQAEDDSNLTGNDTFTVFVLEPTTPPEQRQEGGFSFYYEYQTTNISIKANPLYSFYAEDSSMNYTIWVYDWAKLTDPRDKLIVIIKDAYNNTLFASKPERLEQGIYQLEYSLKDKPLGYYSMTIIAEHIGSMYIYTHNFKVVHLASTAERINQNKYILGIIFIFIISMLIMLFTIAWRRRRDKR